MPGKRNPQRAFEQAAQLAQRQLFQRAIPLYEGLVREFPQEPELVLQLAHCLGLKGERRRAIAYQSQLMEDSGHRPEVLVRCARDRNLWKDFEGALELYEQLFAFRSPWQKDGAYHRIRLRERLNQLEKAQEALREAENGGFRDEQWGWPLIEGLLARRQGDMEKAAHSLEKAESAAPQEMKAQAAAPLAQLADAQGDFENAWATVQRIRGYQQEAAQQLQRLNPLPAPIPEYLSCEPSESVQDGPILLAGLPRSGTSLLSRQLEKNYLITQSEEHNYLAQALDGLRSPSGDLPSPAQLRKGSSARLQAARKAYFKAQQETVGFRNEGPEILLDKNPSLTPLLPWLLVVFPNLRILWIERDRADVWLSSVMQDVPLNPTTCWWHNPQDYLQWSQPICDLGEECAQKLSPQRFQKVDYEALVKSPDKTLSTIAEAFELQARSDEAYQPMVARSPTYAQVIQPIYAHRLNRFANYRDLLSKDERELFELARIRS